jgi:hypothetical protein
MTLGVLLHLCGLVLVLKVLSNGEPLSSKSIKKVVIICCSNGPMVAGAKISPFAATRNMLRTDGRHGDDGSMSSTRLGPFSCTSGSDARRRTAVKRDAALYLMQRQLPCGDWPQEGIGVQLSMWNHVHQLS